MALTLMLTFFIVLPISLVSFEIGRIQLAESQLKVATDAAALGAAIALSKCKSVDAKVRADTASSAGAIFFRRQEVCSTSLSQAAISKTTASDSPAAGQSELNITLDPVTGLVTSEASLGLRPAFGSLLGITAPVLRATSKANSASGSPIDMVIVFDRSCSMSPVLSDAVLTMENFIAQVHDKYPTVNFSLVTIGGSPPCGDRRTPGTRVLVPLSQTNDNYAAMQTALAGLETSCGTWTNRALRLAVQQAAGGGHRPGAQQVIVVMTDGLPDIRADGTCASVVAPSPPEPVSQEPMISRASYGVSQMMNSNKMTLYSIGYYWSYSGTERNWGKEFLNHLTKMAGGKSRYYIASDTNELTGALNAISAGLGISLGLVN